MANDDTIIRNAVGLAPIGVRVEGTNDFGYPEMDGTTKALKVSIAGVTGDINVDETNLSTGGLIGKPVVAGGDFDTVYTAVTQITCSNLPAWYANLVAEDILTVQQIDNTGAVVATYSRDDAAMTVVANVITVTGAAFVGTDSFVVYTNRDRASQHLSEIETAVEIMDDWDESDRAKVNPIVGEAGVTADTGVIDSSTQRVTVATDDTVATDLTDIKTALEAGVSIPNVTHRSPVHFTATYTSNVTITLAGLPFSLTDDSQLVYIKQVNPVANTSSLWISGINCTLEEIANVVTISGAGTPFGSDDVYEVGINDEIPAYDLSTDVIKTTEQSPIQDQYTASVNLVTASDIGAVDDTWVDQGAEIDMRGKTGITFYVSYTANNSTGPLIQILCKDESGGAVEYDLEDVSAYQKVLIDGQTTVYHFTTKNRIPFLQVQSKSAVVGAIEGTLTINYITSWV